jgi:hypothetical protein
MASAGQMIAWRVPVLRGIDPALRRARLLAARGYKPGTIPRHAILGGFWDGGHIVRRHREAS